MIVVISNFHLNSDSVIAKFEKLMDGYSNLPYVVFVLMGNFSTEQ